MLKKPTELKIDGRVLKNKPIKIIKKPIFKIYNEFSISVLRPEDMLHLDFNFINVKIVGDQLIVDNKKFASYLVVNFPPQNIAEEAFFEYDENYEIENESDHDYGLKDPELTTPCKSRISENSRLVFIIPTDRKITYSIEGLLKACTELDLKVAPTASPPSRAVLKASITHEDLLQKVGLLKNIDQSKLILQISDAVPISKAPLSDKTSENASLKEAQKWMARSKMGAFLPRAYDDILRVELSDDLYKGRIRIKMPELKEPTKLETSIEAPFRLIISPNRYAAWVHAPLTVKSSVSKRYELWHTRYALRINEEIVEDDHRLRTIRAIWTKDYGFASSPRSATSPPEHYNPSITTDNPFRMPLDGRDRHDIVHLSANHFITYKDPVTNQTVQNPPIPVDVERLMLTSLGAWMNVRGFWDPHKDTGLSVEEWKHRGTMGRDHYVKVVYKGYLYPFGHKASLVKVTERKFHPLIKMIMVGSLKAFEQKMKVAIATDRILGRAEAISAQVKLCKAFEKEIEALMVSVDGKSKEEITNLTRESKKRFSKETSLAFKVISVRRNLQLEVLANQAVLEFENSLNDIIGNLRPWEYPNVPGNIAFLRQRMYIIVREPERIYLKETGLSGSKSYDLQFPFQSARITTLITPNLDKPEDCPAYENAHHGQQLFYPSVGANQFLFHFILKDYANNEVEFSTPLVFIDQNMLKCSNGGKTKEDVYDEEVKKRLELVQPEYCGNHKPDLSGQSIMYAHSDKDPGKATMETNSITFSAEIPSEYENYKKLMINLGSSEIPPFYPIIYQANVTIPSIKHLAGNDSSVDVQFNDHYLEFEFKGENVGEVFLDLVNVSNLDFNSQGDRSGGLVKPNIGITGFSRKLGPVGGTNLKGLAEGNFDPSDFLGALDAKIFGVISLMDIIKAATALDFSNKADKLPKITTDTTSDKLIAEISWIPGLKDWDNLFIASNNSQPASLTINGKMTVQSSGKSDMDITCTLTSFCLDLIGNFESFLLIRFNKVEFKSQGGKKADVDVDIDDIEFIGCLSFVEKLKEIIPLDGFSDPPSLEVSAKGITAGFSLAIPDIAVGVFSLENISLGAAFTIPFTDEPLSVRFNFCDRHEQFLLTVSCFGGGGFFALTLDPGGIQRLEAAFEFGAKLSLNFGVASGGVYIMAGIYFEMQANPEKAELTGYFRMGGNVSVLGIISVSIELYLELRYEFTSGKCVGKATLTIEVEIIFFSISVEISCEKKFAGSDGDPSFEQTMEKYLDPKTQEEVDPWREYCEAYA